MAIILLITGIILGTLLLLFALTQKKGFGALSNEIHYLDHGDERGIVLYAKEYHLMGRPDAIIKKDNKFFPVEKKTGRTPTKPYANHVIQLMAYCFLVEENYGEVPPGGFLQYNDKEVFVEYTSEKRELVLNILESIIEHRKSNEEPSCNHFYHNM